MIYFRIIYYNKIFTEYKLDYKDIIKLKIHVSILINKHCPDCAELTTTSNNITQLYFNNDTLLGIFWELCFEQISIELIIQKLHIHFAACLKHFKKNINITNMKNLIQWQQDILNKKTITNCETEQNNLELDEDTDSDFEDIILDTIFKHKLTPIITQDNYAKYEILEPQTQKILGKIHVIHNPIDINLLKQLEEERNTPKVQWMNGYNYKPHWGVIVPDRHLSYLQTFDKSKYPAWVSGLGIFLFFIYFNYFN